MGRSFIVYVKDTIWWCPEKSLHIEDTRVCATQDSIGIVRDGDSSEDIDAQLSKIEDDGEKKQRSETPIAKHWRQTRENRNRSRGQESKGLNWRWKRKRYLLPVERRRPVSKGDQCSFRHESDDRAPKPTPKAAPPSEPSMTRGRSALRKKKRQRQKSDWQNSSKTVQIPFERNMYEITLWILASSRVSIL